MKASDLTKSVAAVIAVGMAFTAASWFMPEAAFSHTSTTFYDHALWYDQPTFVTVPAGDRGGTFDFYHNGGGWTAARRDRNFDGVNAWNNVAGADFTWLFRGTRTDLDDTNPCNNGTEESSYDWVNIDGQFDGTSDTAILGEATYCYFVDLFSGRPYHKNTLVRFDQEENWYTGTGSPGSNQFDLRSVTTHETGHATGWWAGHFDLFGSQCPPTTDPIHVMCPRLTQGYAQMRTLMTHDVHTFNVVY